MGFKPKLPPAVDPCRCAPANATLLSNESDFNAVRADIDREVGGVILNDFQVPDGSAKIVPL
jgi:hypothetical protein